jgi:chromosome segregation ATPase
LVQAFKLVRQDKITEVPVQFMTASFDKTLGSCEFLIEFTEQIDDADVEKCFYAHGAKGVNVLTFGNDKGRGAAVAYTHITDLQAKTGFSLSRGEISKSLVTSLESLKKSQKEEKTERDFNEKTRTAEKISLDEFKSKMEEVHDEVQGLGHFQQGIRDDVLSVGNDVQSYGVKMEAGFEGVKQEVLSFIPDFQERIKQLEKEVEYHKNQRDIQEGKTAAQTTKVNQKDKEIAMLLKREEALVKREDSLIARIKELENALLISNTVEKLQELTQFAQEDRVFARAERAELKHSIAEVQESAKTLGDMLSMEEERAAKRPRA